MILSRRAVRKQHRVSGIRFSACNARGRRLSRGSAEFLPVSLSFPVLFPSIKFSKRARTETKRPGWVFRRTRDAIGRMSFGASHLSTLEARSRPATLSSPPETNERGKDKVVGVGAGRGI